MTQRFQGVTICQAHEIGRTTDSRQVESEVAQTIRNVARPSKTGLADNEY